MKRTILVSLVLMLSLLLSALSVSAQSTGRVTVFDRLGVLDDTERAALEEGFGEGRHGTAMYLLTENRRLLENEVRFLCGIDDGASAVVLVVDRAISTYSYELFTFGHVHGVLSDRACNAILDDAVLYSAIKSGRIYEGAARFFTVTEARIVRDWYEPGERYGGVGVSIAVGVVTAVLAGGGSAIGVMLHYRKRRHGASYPLDRYANLQLTCREDRFVGSAVTRVRVQSSGSGGGRGGSRGGGGSRGRR